MFQPVPKDMVKLVSITIPDELKTVWERIPNKSAWVTKHLRELGGWPTHTLHTAWSDTFQMCNMYHKDGICTICMEEMELSEREMIAEYERRRLQVGTREEISDPLMKESIRFGWEGEEE